MEAEASLRAGVDCVADDWVATRGEAVGRLGTREAADGVAAGEEGSRPSMALRAGSRVLATPRHTRDSRKRATPGAGHARTDGERVGPRSRESGDWSERGQGVGNRPRSPKQVRNKLTRIRC